MRQRTVCYALALGIGALLAGCQTPAGRGLPVSKLDGGGQPREIAPVGHANASKPKERAVTLEEEVDGENSRWARLLNPFASRKKRIPLPLSSHNENPPEESSLAGF